uniref:Uncharacterized protein n=1 Tax=Anguilla anguilla TaxID=7936 RepID=A0A0E9WPA0_ANGAN
MQFHVGPTAWHQGSCTLTTTAHYNSNHPLLRALRSHIGNSENKNLKVRLANHTTEKRAKNI